MNIFIKKIHFIKSPDLWAVMIRKNEIQLAYTVCDDYQTAKRILNMQKRINDIYDD